MLTFEYCSINKRYINAIYKLIYEIVLVFINIF